MRQASWSSLQCDTHDCCTGHRSKQQSWAPQLSGSAVCAVSVAHLQLSETILCANDGCLAISVANCQAHAIWVPAQRRGLALEAERPYARERGELTVGMKLAVLRQAGNQVLVRAPCSLLDCTDNGAIACLQERHAGTERTTSRRCKWTCFPGFRVGHLDCCGPSTAAAG